MGSTDDIPPHIKPEHVYVIPFDREAFDRACEAVYVRLGFLLVQANMFEDSIVEMYWIASQEPLVPFIEKVRSVPLGNLVRDAIEVYKQRVPSPELVRRVAALEERIFAAVRLRNEFVHANWAVSEEGWAQRERRPRRDSQGRKIRAHEEVVKMNLEHIEAAANEISNVAEALFDLHDETVAAMGNLPPQSGEVRDGIVYPHGYVYRDLTKK